MSDINFTEPDKGQLIAPAPDSPPHLSVSHWVAVSAALISVILFFMASYYFGSWPFGDFITATLPEMSPLKTLGPPEP